MVVKKRGTCGDIVARIKFPDGVGYIWYCHVHGQVDVKTTTPMMLEDFGILPKQNYQTKVITYKE